jgi:hypothetical protein
MANPISTSPEAIQWAEANFSGMFSSDKRRRQRIIGLAAKMKDFPGRSIPQLCDSPYEVKASYNVLKHFESTPERIQKGHVQVVKNELYTPGTYLLIEDDSEFSWSGKQSIDGLGPIGGFSDYQQGFVLHTTLALRWNDADEFKDLKRPPVAVIGVADQQCFTRRPGKAKSARKQGAPHPGEFKETDAWFHSIDRIGQKPSDDQVRWVRVGDRRADIFEQFEHTRRRGQDFVIRSAQDRGLAACVEGGPTRLSIYLKQLPSMGEYEVEVRRTKGVDARIATVTLTAGTITLRPPFRKGMSTAEQKPQVCNVVCVHERGEPPEGASRISWTLLTSLDVDTVESVRTIVRMYTARWIIEDFHKTLKSGLKAEDLQLETAKRLYAAIAIMSVVATSLLELREVARRDPNAPAVESGLDEIELRILSIRTGRILETVADVILALGRIGGHLNRKRDGFPGIVTLWRGWTYLKSMSEGARLIRQSENCEKFG